MNKKGFLVTDAIGNVIYIPLTSTAAKDIAIAINHSTDCVPATNSCKTVQRHLLSKYISAKSEDEYLRNMIDIVADMGGVIHCRKEGGT